MALLIRSGRVLTMDDALGDLDPADVLIEDGVIAAVGPRPRRARRRGPRRDGHDRHAGLRRHAPPRLADAAPDRRRRLEPVRLLRAHAVDLRELLRGRGRLPREPRRRARGARRRHHDARRPLPHHQLARARRPGDRGARATRASARVFCYGLYPEPVAASVRAWRSTRAGGSTTRGACGASTSRTRGRRSAWGSRRARSRPCRSRRSAGRSSWRASSARTASRATSRWEPTIAGGASSGSSRRDGLLADDVLLVHGSSLTDDELDAVARAGAGIAATPETELQMGMGIRSTARALARGVPTSLGIDIVSNYSGDMFAQMRLQLQARARARARAAARAPPREVGLRRAARARARDPRRRARRRTRRRRRQRSRPASRPTSC